MASKIKEYVKISRVCELRLQDAKKKISKTDLCMIYFVSLAVYMEVMTDNGVGDGDENFWKIVQLNAEGNNRYQSS